MKTITTRLDDEAEAALDRLVAVSGTDQSKVLRNLIIGAERDWVLSMAREQAEQLRADPAYLAEVAAVAADLESLRAW